ncbi:hypothetical protein GA0115233_114812, partial [Streptomyces sp. DI166]
AIGTAGSSTDASDSGTARTPSTAASAPSDPGPAGTRPNTPGHGPTDRPDTAKDTEAHCRAYPRVSGSGRALESAAWKRLTEAAGGADKVETYCANLLGDEAGEADKGRSAAGQPDRGSENGQGAQNGTGNAGGGRTTGPKN